MVRCLACGHGFTYRDGIRYCASCAAPVAADCVACGRLWLPGDRYCAFCATPTGAMAIGAAPAGAARPAAAAGPFGAADEADELRQLALDTLARATLATVSHALPVAKANLDQDDVDSLFAGPVSRS